MLHESWAFFSQFRRLTPVLTERSSFSLFFLRPSYGVFFFLASSLSPTLFSGGDPALLLFSTVAGQRVVIPLSLSWAVCFLRLFLRPVELPATVPHLPDVFFPFFLNVLLRVGKSFPPSFFVLIFVFCPHRHHGILGAACCFHPFPTHSGIFRSVPFVDFFPVAWCANPSDRRIRLTLAAAPIPCLLEARVFPSSLRFSAPPWILAKVDTLPSFVFRGLLIFC